MISPSNWKLQDIEAMIIAGREEALTLEYKASVALSNNKELAKDVSAFANSDGGIIIYGVEEVGHKPIRIDEGINPTGKIKESIENIITDSIRPRIAGLIIHPIDLPSGNQIFVLEIPKSNNAPHMAQHSYYKRYNFKSVPMEHYEILDVMNRQSGPDLWMETGFWEQFITRDSLNFSIYMALKNHSKNPAHYVHITLSVDTLFASKGSDIYDVGETSFILPSEQTVNARKHLFSYSTPLPPIFGHHTFGFVNPKNSLFKRHFFSFDREKIEYKRLTELEAYIHWQIEAPNMTSRYGIEKITTDQKMVNYERKFYVKLQNISRELLLENE